jgi:drug/metabolite transporter (DMT)-like permease
VLQTELMFLGEMGSWIFIGAFELYRRYVERRQSSQSRGYEAVNTTDDHTDGILDTDADSIRSSDPLNPAVKVLTKNYEDRLPLKGFTVSLLALPAICDICGTTLMNVGLLFVVASIYQMTRGALVLFVGLFSVVFLKRRLYLYQWLALVLVVLGVGIVGLAGALYKEDSKSTSTAALLLVKEVIARTKDIASSPDALHTIVGIFLIAGAQIFTATQFVLEEFILEKYALEPLKVVGWEGLFGFLVTALGMMVLHLAIGRTDAGQYGYFDAVEGWRQLTTNRAVGVSSILIMISIG